MILIPNKLALAAHTLFEYRDFILGSIKREIQLKYRNSILGATWVILSPLVMITIYTLVFSSIMTAKIPGATGTFSYGTYLCAGILTWALFAEITSRGQNIFLENANLLKKVSFPFITLPTILVANAFLNFSIIFSLFLIFIIAIGEFPGTALLGIIPIILLQVGFSIGLGISVGILNVFFRDIGHFFNLLLQLWFWCTPIVYPIHILPEGIRSLIQINPMLPIITAYQRILVNAEWPDWNTLWYPAVLTILLWLTSFKLYRKHFDEMMDGL